MGAPRMRFIAHLAVVAGVVSTVFALPTDRHYKEHHDDRDHDHENPMSKHYKVSYDPRPFYIINNMTESPLKKKLESCENGPFSVTGFSIGHRGGATLQFPEETVENTIAGARMGAGILECDVAFTSDRQLACRHSQCDLHTTTNILLHPELAAKCTVPFTPANATFPANALCSTSGTVMTLDSYITLVESIPGHRNYTPELKTPPSQVPMPFNGYTQEQYARDLIDKFIQRNISADRVWAQSFLPADVYQWIAEYPDYGQQAVYLDEDGDTPETLPTASSLERLSA